MRVALCTHGIVVGGVLFAVGVSTGNHGLVLVGLILLPLSFVLGTLGGGEHEPMTVTHEANMPRTAYEDSLRETG